MPNPSDYNYQILEVILRNSLQIVWATGLHSYLMVWYNLKTHPIFCFYPHADFSSFPGAVTPRFSSLASRDWWANMSLWRLMKEGGQGRMVRPRHHHPAPCYFHHWLVSFLRGFLISDDAGMLLPLFPTKEVWTLGRYYPHFTGILPSRVGFGPFLIVSFPQGLLLGHATMRLLWRMVWLRRHHARAGFLG